MVQQGWLIDSDLENPESIIYDPTNTCFYVSNGTTYGVGVTGYITKVSEDGKLYSLKWLDSLNRPTGMAIAEQKLYVADVNVLSIVMLKSF